MLRIANIGGLLSLIYFYYNHHNWIISINETNILSSLIVTSLQYIPVRVLLILSIIFYVYAIIKNKWSLIMYFSTLSLLGILCRISISTLMLEDTTTFIFLKITIPVSYNLKLIYAQDILMNIITTKPEFLTNRLALQEFQQFLTENLDLNEIYKFNASQIRDYIYDLVNEKQNNDINPVRKFMTLLLIVSIIATIISHLKL